MEVKYNYSNNPIVGTITTKGKELDRIELYDGEKHTAYQTWEEFQKALDGASSYCTEHIELNPKRKPFRLMIFFWDLPLLIEFIKGIFPIEEENIMRKTTQKTVIYRANYKQIEFRNLGTLSGYNKQKEYLDIYGEGDNELEQLYTAVIYERSQLYREMIKNMPLTKTKSLEKRLAKIIQSSNKDSKYKW